MISLNINKLRDGLITQLYIMHSLIFKSYCGMFERCLKITLTLHLFPMDQTMSLINTFQRTASKAYLFISINFFFLIQTKFLTFLMLARILVERDWLWLSLQFSCNFKSNTTIEQALRIYFATFIFNDNIIWHRNMLNHKYTLHSFQMWIITYSIKTFFIYIQLFHRREESVERNIKWN